MAKEVDNTNRGALFKAKEQPTENHPGYTGSINVDGREYYLSAWLKESEKVGKYFSLSVKAKDGGKQQDAPAKGITGGKFDDFKGDIPFR